VYDETYRNQKLSIRAAVQACTERLSDTLRAQIEEGAAVLESQLLWMRVGVVALVLVLLFVILSSRLLLLWPISLYEKNIQKDEPLEPGGARELRALSVAYNEMYARNHALTESLAFEAHCDALTGVNNRGSFDALVTLHKTDCALILVDVDYFKQFNDKWGHDMGDAILIEVAATLYSCFRSTDYICRIGGDEFAVIMVDAQPSMRDVIEHKIEKVRSFLRDDSNGLPGATISVGVAFGGPGSTDDGLFHQADAALYATKRAGRDGITFASDLDEQAE
jgi:diguanylate cyclase (GGDEF)-like protein